MTIGELLAKFALESEMQINVITEAGTLVYIPDVRYFREHLHFKTMKEVAALPVTSIMVSLEEGEDGPILLLVINEKTEEQEMMHS